MQHRILSLLAGLSLSLATLSAANISLDFEGFNDLDSANTLYAAQGVTFSGGLILISGAFGGSLNELEYPPNSGTGVFVNDSDTTVIDFATPILSFQGFFTYGGPVTLNFYDSSNALIASVLSAFNTNVAVSGEPGSSPNEELGVATLAQAVRLEISALSTDFTLDDVRFVTDDGGSTTVPEPSTLTMAGAALAAAVLINRRKQ